MMWNMFKLKNKNARTSADVVLVFSLLTLNIFHTFLGLLLVTLNKKILVGLMLPQPTFKCRINVVPTLWINVEITLIRRWKWNKIRRRIFNVVQNWYNVSARYWNNVEATSKQRFIALIKRCFKVVSS